jgi:hypothetical protein
MAKKLTGPEKLIEHPDFPEAVALMLKIASSYSWNFWGNIIRKPNRVPFKKKDKKTVSFKATKTLPSGTFSPYGRPLRRRKK